MHLLAFAAPIQLFPDGSLLIHVALILAMIWILNRTLYKPLNRIIELREKSKGGRSSEAVDILKDVEQKEAHYAKELFEARNKGYEYSEKEQRKAVEVREQKLKDAKAEYAAKFEGDKAELEKHKANAREVIKTEAEKNAEDIAATILKA